MSPLIIADIIIGSICSTVALLHFLVFLGRPELRANLFFAIMSIAAAGSALSELWVYRATTLDAFNLAFKVQINFQAILWIALVWFIVVYTGTARRWLAIAVTSAYFLALTINIISPFGVIYSKITALHSFKLPWGEQITYASGTLNPWRFIADIAWLFLLFLVIESCVRWYRQGQNNRAIILGASILAFLGLAYLHGTLMDLGIVDPPGIVSFTFLGLVLIMSGSLSAEVVRASVLSREVKANEQKWSSLLENVKLLIIGVDRNGRIDYVNPCFTQVSGLPVEEVLGRSFADFAPEQDRKHLLELFEAAIGGNIKQHYQATLLKKDGKERQVLWSNVLLQDQAGAVSGILSVGADITEQLEAEAARDKALKELEAFKSRLEEENIYLREEIQYQHGFSEIVGESNALLYVLSKVKQVSQTDATVLVQGETGVGKELISRAIHRESPRSEKPFITLNCAALPPNLVESELFGHEKGAFTGATQLRKGRFELADGGTLFMDEVSELPLEVQAKLLRVLQDGEFERVGGSHTLSADVRVIAASNRNLSEETAAARFRADLYYRLSVYPISVPPLRKRREDIPLLVEHFVRQIAPKVGKTIDQIPPHVMEELRAYDWPGNVRELKNVLERAVITSQDTVLRLSEGFRDENQSLLTQAYSNDGWQSLDEVQRRYILKVLQMTEGRIEGPGGAAEILQIKPSTLRSRLQKLGIRGRQNRWGAPNPTKQEPHSPHP